MRRLIPLAALILAGCATRPQVPPARPDVRPTDQPAEPGDLVGLTAADLLRRFGQPALQVREGPGLKLQFRGSACVLDAYLYAPGGQGLERVAHVDARLPSGDTTDQRGCIAALQRA